MCNVLNFFLSCPNEGLALPVNERVKAIPVEEPGRACANTLHRDFFVFYGERGGTFLRADDNACCYGGEWPDTFRHLALLILQNEAEWGALYFAFQGDKEELREEWLRPPHCPERLSRGVVYALNRETAKDTLRLIPEPAERARLAFHNEMEQLKGRLLALVGESVRVECGHGRIVAGVLEQYQPEYGFFSVRTSTGVETLVPCQVVEVAAAACREK